MQSHRRRLIASLAAVLALAVLLVGVGVVRERQSAERAWEEARVRVMSLQRTLDARSDSRSALWGDTTTESAWPHYEAALDAVADWNAHELLSALKGEDEAALALRAGFLEKGGDALAHLRRAAHAGSATRHVDWSAGFEVGATRLMEARKLVHLCELRMQQLREAGADVEAVRVLLDGLQLGGDLAQGPLLIEELVGVSLLPCPTLLEGAEHGTLATLSPEARLLLREGLTLLDARLAWRPRGIEAELVLFAHAVEAARAADESGPGEGPLAALRRADTRGLEAAAERVERSLTLAAELEDAFTVGPEAVQAFVERTERIRASEQSDDVAALDSILPVIGSAVRGRLHSVGRFRLLVRALVDSESHTDPWIAQLFHETTDADGRALTLDHPLFEAIEVRVATP